MNPFLPTSAQTVEILGVQGLGTHIARIRLMGDFYAVYEPIPITVGEERIQAARNFIPIVKQIAVRIRLERIGPVPADFQRVGYFVPICIRIVRFCFVLLEFRYIGEAVGIRIDALFSLHLLFRALDGPTRPHDEASQLRHGGGSFLLHCLINGITRHPEEQRSAKSQVAFLVELVEFAGQLGEFYFNGVFQDFDGTFLHFGKKGVGAAGQAYSQSEQGEER